MARNPMTGGRDAPEPPAGVAEASGADQAALSLELDDDGVAWLVFDRPDSRVNLLTSGTMGQLDALLGEIEGFAAAGRVKVLIVRSAKPGQFIAGADVDEIAGVTDPADAMAKAAAAQQVLRRLELLPIPTIAAISGACLGGGVELALACAFRLADDQPATRIGLPEVRLGIVPGFGGTARLPRLVGLRAATEMIVTGRAVSARRAHRIGLVDELVPASIYMDRVRRFAWERVDQGAPHRPRRRRRGTAARLLDDTAPGRRLILWQARRRVLRETRGHYPAPLAALDLLGQTLAVPLEVALRREAEVVGRLATSQVCKQLIHVFRLMEGAKKPSVAADPASVHRVMVLGAGVMGGGIAQLLAYRGVGVRLKDIHPDALAAGLRHARRIFDTAVARGRLDRREARRRMDLISPTLDYAGAETADMVIEAVVEKPDVKEQVLAEVEARVEAGCVIASNTSAISITRLQRGLKRPEAFCGLHFFNPVHRMPLVEIVRGEATGDGAIATAFALARRLEKTPLVVRDGAGFLVNRILSPYLNEAGWLLLGGASIEKVDQALVDFGMPMGPFRLLDEVGLDVAGHVGAVLYEAFGERMQPAPALQALAGTDRLGRKAGRGFYRYENGRSRGVDPAIYESLGDTVPARRREPQAAAIVERAVLAMVNEAARVLADGIVASAGDVDLGMIAGTGFPPFRGGLLRYADSLGTAAVLERLRSLESELGARFAPAPLIQERAAEGRGFYA